MNYESLHIGECMSWPAIDALNLFCVVVASLLHVLFVAIFTDLWQHEEENKWAEQVEIRKVGIWQRDSLFQEHQNQSAMLSFLPRTRWHVCSLIGLPFHVTIVLTVYMPQSRHRKVVHWFVGVRYLQLSQTFSCTKPDELDPAVPDDCLNGFCFELWPAA